MNTLIISRDLIEYAVKENDASIIVIKTDKNIENFSEIFSNYLNTYMLNVVKLTNDVNKANAKIIDPNYKKHEMDKYMDSFSEIYKKMEDFKRENFIFQLDNQFIDVRDFFWNDDKIMDYEILSLDEWLVKKGDEISKKPDFGY